ncbi:MAG: hypothetical protein HQ567_32165 [Candidatus Nealsonbacteria bacterium]|nr:hypothetical protein [Candidatus Nealsonbacteria bacterium]
MSENLTVIYTARTAPEAHLLKNALTEMGIPAAVENDVLERGSGVDAVGWATQARVVVPEVHALLARQTALEFERKGLADLAALTEPPIERPVQQPAASGEEPGDVWPEEDESTSDVIVDAWPACPMCGTKRTARCPICNTTGNDFPPVDMGFVWVPDAEGEEEPPATFICTMCDEPFAPEHASICMQCGYAFPDGYEVEPPKATDEKIDSRVMAVVVGLGLVAGAAVAYFIYFI